MNTNLIEILLMADGCKPIVYGHSETGIPIIGMVTPSGTHVVAKGESVEECLRALCRYRGIALPPPLPPASVSTVNQAQWDRFLSGHGPWT